MDSLMDQNPGRQIIPVQLLRRVPVPEPGEHLGQTKARGLPHPMLGVVVPSGPDHGVALTPAAVVTFSTLLPSPFACLAREGGQFLAADLLEVEPLRQQGLRELPEASRPPSFGASSTGCVPTQP